MHENFEGNKLHLIKLINSFINGDFNDENNKVFFSIKRKVSKFNSFSTFTEDLINNYKFELEKYFDFKFSEEKSDEIILNLKFYYTYEELNFKDYNDLIKNIFITAENIQDDSFVESVFLNAFALRGSVDPNANFLTIDWKSKKTDPTNINTLYKLLVRYSDITKVNLNFRELQPNSIAKNTQVRFNLMYAYSLIGKDTPNYILMDFFKENENSFDLELINKRENINERIFDYLSILGIELNESDISMRREELNLPNSYDEEVRRSSELIKFAKNTLKEQCYACKDYYNLDDRTFYYRSSDKYYLEIHHILPFSINKQTNDDIRNLVKLCPTCHKALHPTRGPEELQKELIHNIIKNNHAFLNFINENYKEHRNDILNFVYKNLK